MTQRTRVALSQFYAPSMFDEGGKDEDDPSHPAFVPLNERSEAGAMRWWRKRAVEDRKRTGRVVLYEDQS